ncbi:MAG: class B sortase [Lachnospiraceae bacterium]|nr:class B sortase [Lachnospiraceae bacterium]
MNLLDIKTQDDIEDGIGKIPSSENEKGKKIVFLFQVAGVILILGSLFYIGRVFLDYHKASSEYEALEKEVFGDVQPIITEAEENPSAPIETDEDELIFAGVAKLHEENPDVVGWIKFDNLELSYPVMQGTDNDYYLTHTFSGKSNPSGSIFMEAMNSYDFNDSHTLLYGHNMKNLSMFGALKKYKNGGFYPGNEYFTIYTLDQIYRYQIFAYYDVPADDEIYQVGFEPGDEFQELLNHMKRRSYYDTGVKVVSTDKVVTLSTCSSEGIRFVVNAKRIYEN